MQAFIDFLIKNLLKLWPIARVYEWDAAFRCRNGIIREPLGPGLHWRWWFVDEVMTWPSTEMSAVLASGVITTTDGTAVIVSGNVRYRITDYILCRRRIFDNAATFRRNIFGQLCTECAASSIMVLMGDRRALEEKLLAKANEMAKEWGINLVALNLTDLAPTTPTHHTSDGSFFVQSAGVA